MTTTRLVLVRHGESWAQDAQVVGGHAGCRGLSARGRSQVERLRDRLERTAELADATALYASVMPRAVETAEVLASAIGGLVAVQDCDFCEGHPGDADGLTWAEASERFAIEQQPFNPDARFAPSAETWNEMQARVSRGLDGIVERHRGESVVVACHGGVILHSMVRWLGLEPAGRDRAWLNPLNASITEWRIAHDGGDRVELVRFNDASHLAD